MASMSAQDEFIHYRETVLFLRDRKLMGRRKIAEELGVHPSKVQRWLRKIDNEPVEASVEEIDANMFKQNQKLMDKNRITRRISREVVRIENAITEYSSGLLDVFKKYKLSKLTKKHSKESDAVGIIQLSDAHFNEIVDLVDNKYNFKIASQRMKSLADKAKVYLNALGVSHVLIAMTGDMLNSDRRVDEIMAQSTNRSRATFIAVDILQQFILDINQDFDVSVACVTGNESRVKDELGWTEQVASDNYDYTMFNILRLLFKDSRGVSFVEGGCLELVVEVNGQNVLMLHGNGSIRSNVEKDVQGIMGRYAAKGVTLDYVIFGHKHSAMLGDVYSRSSSLVGSNSYSDVGLGMTSRASQNVYILRADGSRDAIKVDLQEASSVGYNINKELEFYNVEEDALDKPKSIVVKI